MKAIYRSDLQCSVWYFTYACEARTGILWMDDGHCCDMSGCVSLFEKIDPDVSTIMTMSGQNKDTTYKRSSKGWVAIPTNDQEF